MKKLRRLIILVVVVLVVLILAVGLLIDTLTKTAIEEGSTFALGVETTVDDVNLSLLRGRLSLERMRIANPEGFKSDHLMRFGEFEVNMRPGSVLSDTVELERFLLHSLDVNIEQRIGGSNIATIMGNLERFGSKEPAEKEKGSGKKVKVDTISIKDVVVHYHLLPDVSPVPVTVRVPQIEMTQVSSEDGEGIRMAQLVQKVMIAIMEGIITESEGLVQGEFLNGMQSQLSDARAAIGQSLKEGAVKAGEQLEKAGTEAKEKGEKAIGDLLDGMLKPLEKE